MIYQCGRFSIAQVMHGEDLLCLFPMGEGVGFDQMILQALVFAVGFGVPEDSVGAGRSFRVD